MIIEAFEAIAGQQPEHIAIKTKNTEFSYYQLDAYANRVAHQIINSNSSDHPGQAALLFEHGPGMIVAILAALKAAKTYVPMDNTYPENRLAYMLEDSEAGLILTNNENIQLAQRLSRSNSSTSDIQVINIDEIPAFSEQPGSDSTSPALSRNPDAPAYILYTSGSTGKPKGVVQTSRNMMYYTRQWIKRFEIVSEDKMTLFSSFSHDGSVQDMFAALLAGATLFPYYIKRDAGTYSLYNMLAKEQMTIWHSVPSLFRFFAGTLTSKDSFPHLRYVLLGGEPLREHDLELFHSYFPNALLANVYGQTESSVGAVCKISHQDSFNKVTIGEPLDETQIVLVAEDGEIVEEMGTGEIVISSNYLSPGYWKDDEKTEDVFTADDDMGRLYWTGDKGRWTTDQRIKVLGRIDNQVKIRGFRVEPGEIETVLLRFPAVEEAAVVIKESQPGEPLLCAYYTSAQDISQSVLREHLNGEVPDYMVPAYFIPLPSMPLTPTNKIDRANLPDPDRNTIEKIQYEPPQTEIEKKMAAIWEEVLGVDNIGVNSNFIDLGGHSLIVISIISQIHQVFDVELQLNDVFDNPTVREMSKLVEAADKISFHAIEKAAQKPHYPASPEQLRLYMLSEIDGIGVTYNLPLVMSVKGELDVPRLEQAIRGIIARHESLRTSFHWQEGQLVQIIHPDPPFDMQYPDAEKADVQHVIQQFIRPFDLTRAPLFRAGLMATGPNEHLFMMDIHHIVSDGVSGLILSMDFSRLYAGETLDAPKLQYKDYSEWLHGLLNSDKLKQMEEYWLNHFSGELPVLNLPLNFPRPEVQCFEGEILNFSISHQQNHALRTLAKDTGSTPFMVLLAVYNLLLHKYSGDTDIIIGCIQAGRNHVDLEHVVGMFARTLPMRNFPRPNVSFNDFLEEVKQNTLAAFENEIYPFQTLLQKLNVPKIPGRNPLFDAAFIMHTARMTAPPSRETDNSVTLEFRQSKNTTSKFDLLLDVIEREGVFYLAFQYCTGLFKRETIQLMIDRFLVLLNDILDKGNLMIGELEFKTDKEKELKKDETVDFDF